jgi:dihydroorotate dehydrogenase (NAD+) catalytic subunit
MVDLTTKIGSLTLQNPIMPASGTFSRDMAEVFELDMLGALVTKTITAEIRGGNPTPRVCEVDGGMLNSIGIPSKGLAAFLANELPGYARYSAPLVVSVSAPTVDGFAALVRQLNVPGIAAIEANISCPNIEEDGKAFAMRPDTTARVVEALRRETDLPLWAKLTPNTGETVEVAQAAESAGADALVVANTILSMAIDARTRKPKLGNLMGGLSGPAFKPIALRMAYQSVRSVDIPVIGCGGISTVEDVAEFLVVGACAVQVGTASFVNPTAMPRLRDDLQVFLAEQGYASVSDFVGSIRDGAPGDAVRFMEAAP